MCLLILFFVLMCTCAMVDLWITDIFGQRVLISNKHGEKLVGLLHEACSKELVILCHGFRATKVSLSHLYETSRPSLIASVFLKYSENTTVFKITKNPVSCLANTKKCCVNVAKLWYLLCIKNKNKAWTSF